MSVILLALGNPNAGDDSIGNRIVSILRQKIKHPDLSIVEACVTGLDVLNLISGYDKAVIIDAIKTENGKPGTVYRFSPERIITNDKISPHEINLITALELGRQTGTEMPSKIVIFGIEASDTTGFKDECTPEVKAAIPRCVDMVIQELGLLIVAK
jgi:hydrogenase maturation protease